MDVAERAALARALRTIRGSAFAREYGLDNVQSPADLRRAMPLTTYETYRPWIDRACDGELTALLRPGERVLMFATSSGTTAAPKRIPVTPAFVSDYRRGWNTFGLKMLSDHPEAVLRAILQSSGRYDAERTAGGIPCGAITGLLARTQKRIVRRFYVSRPEVTHIKDPTARYYTLMRLGIVRDVAFAITANPATLIQMARTADEASEDLIRDVRDGTLCSRRVDDPALRALLAARLRPDPERARELEHLRREHGVLRPRDYWHIVFLACWTGGSLGYYLERLADWWGDVPVRDGGLLASEGRVSIPLEDNAPVGVLDVTAGFFEFIPADQIEAATPEVLTAAEVEPGEDYEVVLTNTAGLVRYRLADVVRVHGRLGPVPLVAFLYRAGRVASVAGEKLTENQVVAAVTAARAAANLPEFDFVLAPHWDDPPFYRLLCDRTLPPAFENRLDEALARQNEEYASRRRSRRLGEPAVLSLPAGTLQSFDRGRLAAQRGSAEQFKRACLLTRVGDDERLLGGPAIAIPPTPGA